MLVRCRLGTSITTLPLLTRKIRTVDVVDAPKKGLCLEFVMDTGLATSAWCAKCSDVNCAPTDSGISQRRTRSSNVNPYCGTSICRPTASNLALSCIFVTAIPIAQGPHMMLLLFTPASHLSHFNSQIHALKGMSHCSSTIVVCISITGEELYECSHPRCDDVWRPR